MSVKDLQSAESSTAQAKSTKHPDVLCFDQSKLENCLFSKKNHLKQNFFNTEKIAHHDDGEWKNSYKQYNFCFCLTAFLVSTLSKDSSFHWSRGGFKLPSTRVLPSARAHKNRIQSNQERYRGPQPEHFMPNPSKANT